MLGSLLGSGLSCLSASYMNDQQLRYSAFRQQNMARQRAGLSDLYESSLGAELLYGQNGCAAGMPLTERPKPPAAKIGKVTPKPGYIYIHGDVRLKRWSDYTMTQKPRVLWKIFKAWLAQ